MSLECLQDSSRTCIYVYIEDYMSIWKPGQALHRAHRALRKRGVTKAKLKAAEVMDYVPTNIPDADAPEKAARMEPQIYSRSISSNLKRLKVD